MTSRFSDAARKLLEETMTVKGYEWESDFAKTHRAEGETIGEVKALLLMLEARGVVLSDGVRERIEGCTDRDRIERWIKRAATVERAEDLFA